MTRDVEFLLQTTRFRLGHYEGASSYLYTRIQMTIGIKDTIKVVPIRRLNSYNH